MKPEAVETSSDLENLQRRQAEMQSVIDALRTEVRRLREERSVLEKRLSDARKDNQFERQSRRAALNLMEDAIAARQAEQHENAERRRAEEELRLANRRKDEFLATLAHELRNPLAPIRNSLHILRLARDDKAAMDQVQDMIERQVNHMVRLVDDLLEISRITRGKLELQKERVELGEVVERAIEISRSLIDQAHHQLSVSLPSDPVFIDGDPVRLVQVVANLLNNAAKYTVENGSISLTARREGSHARIAVRDTGIGIAPEMLPRIFDLFTQVDRSSDRSRDGLGIGLTLVRQLVLMHGGTVQARSEGLGQGSEFLVELPLAESVPAIAADAPQHASQPDRWHRVLVVDDNRDAADSLAMILRLVGVEVRTAHSGESALAKLPDFAPSAAFIDLSMPRMDGFELARRIRALPAGKDMLLIALTGLGQEEDRRLAAAAGFDRHFVKPADLQAVKSVLKIES